MLAHTDLRLGSARRGCRSGPHQVRYFFESGAVGTVCQIIGATRISR